MRPIKRGSDLGDQVTERIRSAILRGDLCPGSRVRQEDLAAELAVSRAPVREALLVLQREGLVQSEPSSGMIVAPLDAKLIRDLYGFREGVERQTAEILARRTDVIVGSIQNVLIHGRDAVRSDDFSVSVAIDLDLRFHTALYDAVGNRILSDVMRGQWINMRRVMAATLTLDGYAQQIWDEHAAIFAAIVAHDDVRAGELAAAHTRTASIKLTQGHSAMEGSNAPHELGTAV